VRHLLAAARLHIVLIAGLGTLTYGWLMTGRHLVDLALLAALDWLLLDLGNKLSDLPEDEINSPAEARWVRAHARAIAAAITALFGGSLIATALSRPALLPARLAFQAGGLLYNFRLLPGRRRLKQIYAAKNAAAACLFIITVVGYPLLALRGELRVDAAWVAVMSGFFFFFEMSFEVIYDFKDLAGDRAQRVPTYPAVHGERGGRLAFDLFVLLAAAILLGGWALGAVGFKELIILLAPALQAAAFELFARRGYRARDTVLVTHLGSLQLLAYNLYILVGLPIP
jgi:4-hydroxybenzoate polyprenyltransferase